MDKFTKESIAHVVAGLFITVAAVFFLGMMLAVGIPIWKQVFCEIQGGNQTECFLSV